MNVKKGTRAALKSFCGAECYLALSMKAKATFRQKANEALETFGELSSRDVHQLAMYAQLWEEYGKLTEQIARDGAVIESDTMAGRRVFPNPAVRMRHDVINQLLAIGKNFGFSPLDRKRLNAEKKQEDPLAAWVDEQ